MTQPNPAEEPFFMSCEVLIPLTIDQVREIAYQAAGAASASFMQAHPDFTMPEAAIIEGVERVLADLCPEAAE